MVELNEVPGAEAASDRLRKDYSCPTTDSKRRRDDRPSFGFIAEKRSVRFRFPEAVSRRRILRAHSGHSYLCAFYGG